VFSDPRGQGHVPTSLAAASDKNPRAIWAAATRAQVMVRVSGGVFVGGGDWRSMVTTPLASRLSPAAASDRERGRMCLNVYDS